jgi:mono/diheme cytochrome c family protein
MARLPAFATALFLIAIVLAAVGCGSQPYPAHLTYPLRADFLVARLPESPPEGPPAAGKLDEFVASLNERGGKVYNPADFREKDKSRLLEALNECFGTPAGPTVRGDDAIAALAQQLRLQPEQLAAGSKLYKVHCLQCHGLTGDGRGPTGEWVYPFPRDFRQGIFKYVSSAGSAARKPARDDLHRVVRQGIERTSMPPFAHFSDQQCEQVVAYTIHLSLRGEVEYRTTLARLADDDREDDIAAEARSRLKTALQQWVDADSARIVPALLPTPEREEEKLSGPHQESVRRGYLLFSNQATGCISCHVDFGRQSRYLYDAWGSTVRPTDLTEGAFRGGKRPLDLFQRIRGGISASGMPAATSLTEQQVWDLVHFVQALPYPRMLPAEVRNRIYPPQK